MVTLRPTSFRAAARSVPDGVDNLAQGSAAHRLLSSPHTPYCPRFSTVSLGSAARSRWRSSLRAMASTTRARAKRSPCTTLATYVPVMRSGSHTRAARPCWEAGGGRERARGRGVLRARASDCVSLESPPSGPALLRTPGRVLMPRARTLRSACTGVGGGGVSLRRVVGSARRAAARREAVRLVARPRQAVQVQARRGAGRDAARPARARPPDSPFAPSRDRAARRDRHILLAERGSVNHQLVRRLDARPPPPRR